MKMVVAIFKPDWFKPAAVVGYWLTNVLGFWLMHKGAEKVMEREPRKYGWRDLARDVPGAGEHVGRPHDVRVTDPGLAAALGRDHARVNSFHRQGITKDHLAPGLRAVALADGGVVEAFVHGDLPFVGIQWHPERPGPAPDLDDLILHRWLEGSIHRV